MTHTPDTLEHALSELTAPVGEGATLWQAALDQESGRRRWTGWRRFVPAAAILAVLFTIASVTLLRDDRSRARQVMRSTDARPESAVTSEDYSDYVSPSLPPDGQLVAPAMPGLAASPPPMSPGLTGNDLANAPPAGGTTSGTNRSEPALVRHVARRVEIELLTDDVAATFARVNHLLSPASGEYAEGTSLTGEAERAAGQLTLRIASDRLDTFLNELRGIAKVARETSAAEDVTDQVVDLEARVDNARRIEQELLELLANRAQADLDDILEVRTQLNNVRLEIERLTAQRDRLSALTRLSRVLVLIRHAGADSAPPASDTILGRAVRRGWGSLIDSVGWVVEVLVGGLLVWVLLGGAAAVIWRIFRGGRVVR